jgi:hypothetical protein
VESGNVVGGQQQTAQGYSAQGYQQTQYPAYQYGYPYGYHYSNPYLTLFKEEVPIASWYGSRKPSPKGTPNRSHFKAGSMGCVTTAIAAAIMSVHYLFTLFPWGLPIISCILFGMTIPFFMGLYGFYRNYGMTIALGSAMALATCQVIFIAFAFYAQLGDWSYPSLYMYEMLDWYPLAYAFMGTGYLLLGMAMHQTKAYIYPMADPRAMNNMSSFGIVTSCILFFFTAGLYETHGCVWSIFAMSGWIVLAFSLFGYMRSFNDAPIPIMGPKETSADEGFEYSPQ